jgi:hypothetical protein
MAPRSPIQTVVRALRKRASELQRELDTIQNTLRSLGGLGKSVGRAQGPKRRLSAAGRAAISRAAKRRWAQYRSKLRKG